ncbi:ATP-binding cassette sub-family C member 10 [Tympanuchus pallidicinctus]|uniref:ATP-binding cassette sub-family C member 10 n=1 Tax=Tympanuchus pallidicinctus TaxID=109042 RepID=UPI00228701BE|nr:ATP-binding cassette sub-family C member 10 [Tympanuchus pallidicinctus]XP_052537406.1 ATP-binding cassette sub-family C member 10 [Tympanuchus pallidicinctus]XP_052537415.1 ATP-binding cassette sub-family C member 10 [Tympanuchus pallidicinctus]XP_052537421.1 ATP-binding cassette sub-family C member 10 [Tympanuchus pallidicinctus]XP_052537431.1 ATP-binding cassette sub-family C member 10 [Tympanuchus pallidicinctus]XP_052537442.1 ATP-binding cassette sub-family C member 10 [Tympanuchus pal
MENILAGLCGTSPEDPLPVWVHGRVGHCFNQLALNVFPHVILAAVSACFLGTPRSGSGMSHRRGWRCRIAMSFVLAGLLLADIIPAAISQQELGPVYLEVLASGIAALTWLTHGLALIMLCRSIHGSARGPAALALLTLLPLPSLLITLVWYCQSGTAWSPAHPAVSSRFTILCLKLASLLTYVISYLLPAADRHEFFSINSSWQQDQLISEPGISVSDQQGVAEDGESWLSRFFYAWMNPLMKRGYQWKLNQPQDVCLLPRKLQAARVCDQFYACWQKKATVHQVEEETVSLTSPIIAGDSGSSNALDRSHHAQEAVQLLSVLHAAFGLRFYSLGFLKLAGSLLSFSGPLLLNLLVNFMESQQEPLSHGVLYALGLFAGSFVGALLRNQFSYEVQKVMLMVRAAVISAIYRKALRVGSTSLSRFTVGEIVNFMSTDTSRLVNFCLSFHEVWSLPFQFAITLYLLYQQVGVAFLGGLALALLLVPINKVIANRIMMSNTEMLKHKDTRVKLMTEFLSGIRVIKFYAWEKHFSTRINACRAKELQKLRAIKYLDAVCVYLWAALPVVVSIVIFITYVLMGHQLTATKVFTALALVGMLILPLNSFPWVLNGTLEAKVSLDRIQRFLELMDQDLEAYYALGSPSGTASAIDIRGADFSWVPAIQGSTSQPLSTGSLQLHIENLSVRKGMLLGVVGKVGSGKSSLLAAITGELIKQGGQVYICDLEQGFGLATQEPWIQFATVRENILFGRQYDARLYEEVVEACALSEDLNVLPAGDQTEVGENGVTLSGGQKARIALARAVYQEKEFYLLDDPLAAVDADVANHLMQKCILGILQHKTRILCTHRTEFLEKADALLLMDNGRIIKTGPPADILPLVESVPKFKDMNKRRNDKDSDEQDQEEVIETEAEESSQDKCLLHKEEEKKEGALDFQVYKAYWLAMGSCLALSILLSLLLMQASRNISDWWLSHWISSISQAANTSVMVSSASLPSTKLLLFSVVGLVSPVQVLNTAPVPSNASMDVNFYLAVYGGIAGANSLFTIFRAFLFAYGTIRAAIVIHKRLLQRVIKATVTFFDTTPTGRILNRFSSDLYCVDDSLPFILNIFLANMYGLLGMLVIITYGLPWIGLVLLPLAAIYFSIQRYYRRTSRELKRLYSVTLSPIYTHFSETLSGLSSIRALRATQRFELENELRLEHNQRCLFASNTAMQWLDIRLQMIGVAVITAIAGIAIIQHQKQIGNPGLVGLALSYALSVTNLLSGLISSFTTTETMMVSVERTEEYTTDIPMEPQNKLVQVAADWPSQGLVEFQQVILAYRAGLPNALDGVSFTVYPGEKVGIVGRTGSGKSTLFLALFRMLELKAGRILLDGVDSQLVGLEELRSRLAIIPQDPFLFSGSIRENLDPQGKWTDAELHEVLEQCHLRDAVTQIGGLDSELGERGKSLSVGQRQLVCLARALLTQAKVLCIDEATASVDQKTDQLLQQTIRQRFADKTVLTIAHRLNTILDSDRVLVMQAGRVVELDSPACLSKKDGSLFQRLLHSGQQ